MKFSDLGLSEDVLRAVADAGYETPTPIQEQAIPLVFQGLDILGCAQTGTGKTASFTLPMIDKLAAGQAKARMPRSLILEPTRELAAQVADNFETYGKYHKLTKALLIGGVSLADQVRVIDRGVDVLIATPGRLLDLFERGKLLLTDVKILVVDEADRMLDMGFIPDVERIVTFIPKFRQTLFFSATMPPEIRRLADAFLTNPREISVSPPATAAETVIQALVMVRPAGRPGGDPKEKRETLRRLVKTEKVKNALVFCNRKRDVGVVHRSLVRHGFNAAQLHGDMAQSARMETLDRFKNGDFQLLVCSDVAARGLDIVNMSHVFNFDVPSHAEDYVHRIGRTGRAGLTGHAFTLATPEDSKYLAAITRLIGKKIPLHGEETPAAAVAEPARPVDAAVNQPQAPQPATPAPSESGEPPPPKRRRRGRGRSRDGQQDRDGRPQPDQGRDERPERQKKQPERKQKRTERPNGNDRAEGPVVGMGRHMPAFMRPPPEPKK
jgi:superfamily II DNA/RNA helicase